MALFTSIRGTGAEISIYVNEHPTEEFLLVPVAQHREGNKFDQAKWDETMRLIESFRGKFPVLPDEAFSTESLCD